MKSFFDYGKATHTPSLKPGLYNARVVDCGDPEGNRYQVWVEIANYMTRVYEDIIVCSCSSKELADIIASKFPPTPFEKDTK